MNTVPLPNGKQALTLDRIPLSFLTWAAARTQLATLGRGWDLWQSPLSYAIYIVRID